MNENKSKGINIVVRRIIAYVVLVILTVLCLVWFYLLFVNSTRSKGELISGFTPLPSTHFIKNWNGMLHSTQPIVRGMLNSVFVAACSAALCTYFSTRTAYAIHTYRFKARKAALTFILAVMMIPTQVTALGFIQLITKMGLMDNYIPLIVPAIEEHATFYYMKQYI